MNVETYKYILGVSGVLIMLLISCVLYFLKKETKEKEVKTAELSSNFSSFGEKVLSKFDALSREIHEFKEIFIDVSGEVKRNSLDIREGKKERTEIDRKLNTTILEVEKIKIDLKKS